MKKKNKKLADSGISITLKKQEDKSTLLPIATIFAVSLICAITVASTVLTFVSILNISADRTALFFASVFFAFLFVFLFSRFKKRYVVTLCTCGTAVFLCLVSLKSITAAAVSMYYQGFITISRYMGWDEPKPAEGVIIPNDGRVLFLLVIIALLLCCFCSYFIAVRKSFIPAFLLIFPFFEIGAAFGCVPNYFWFSAYIGSVVAVFMYTRANKSAVRKKGRITTGRKSIKHSNFAFGALIAAAATVAVFFGGRYVLNNVGFDRPEDMDMLRHVVKNGYSSVFDYFTGEDRDGSLKEGKLLKLDDRNIKLRHYFNLETSMQETDEPIYLRGYSATVYTGTKWQQTENYENYNKLFSDLKAASYRMSGINGSLLSSCDNYRELPSARFKVTKLRRKKEYAYQTYGADFDETFTEINDSAMKPKSEAEYEYNTYLGFDNSLNISKSRIYKSNQFKTLFGEYKKFVKAEYTKSTVTPRVKSLAMSFRTDNRYKMVDDIRRYFSKNTKTTLIVDKSPSDVDFVEHFLFETKRGYDAHYATAAAVLLQAAGYPARYVEGYAITPKQFNETKTKHKYGYVTYNVTDMNAHAWVEIFDNDYGWIPVEVTPGLYKGSMYDTMKEYESKADENKESDKKEDETPLEPPEPEEEYQKPEETDEEEPDDYLVGEKSKYVYITVWQAALLIAALVLVAAVVLWCIAARLAAGVRKNKMLTAAPHSAVPVMNRYFNRLVSLSGINSDKISSYNELCQKLGENVTGEDPPDFERIINTLQKFAFSREGVTKVESAAAAGQILRYSKMLYKELKPFKRFIFKFIYAM